MNRLTDAQRILIGRAMAAVSALFATFGLSVYLGLERYEELYGDWMLHNTLGPLLLSGLFWFMVASQPRNRAVWVFGWCGLFQALNAFGIALERWTLDGPGEWVGPAGIARGDASFWTALGALLSHSIWLPGIIPMVTLSLLWFPDGRHTSPRWKPVSAMAIGTMAVGTAALAWSARWFGSGVYPTENEADGAGIFDAAFSFIGLAALLSIASLVVRYRRSRGAERRQFRWVAWAMGVVVPAWIASNFYDLMTAAGPGSWPTFKLATLLSLPVLFGGYAIAIWRHQLFDVDVVISRTLRYGFLAAFIGGVYVAIVFGVGAAIGESAGSDGLALTATVVVAFMFQPVRRRADRAANRLVFGQRATPYEVLTDLTLRLGRAETSSGLLDRIVKRLAEGTGAELAVLWQQTGDGVRPSAHWPPDADVGAVPADAVPIERAGRRLGALSVRKRPGEELNPTEQRLLGDLAGSAGLVLDKARLDAALALQADQLQESRRRLVDAEEEERQRLERRLHDGPQQQLVGVKVQLGLAATQARAEGASALAGQIDFLADEAQLALEEIRSLAQGIYPPLLESDGLVAAVQSLAHSLPIPVEVRAVRGADHDDDVEVAVYFCVAEALTNVAKHSGATTATVELQFARTSLRFSVCDDGVGFDPSTTNGSATGLGGLADRLAAVGGRITVDSTPGRGTAISGVVTVDSEELVPV